MGVYVVISEDGNTLYKTSSHFDESEALEALSGIIYTDRAGKEQTGGHWSVEQIETVTKSLEFPEDTTSWDKLVAFNSFYADTCRVLDDAAIIKAAHAFYFCDEDAPADKLMRYYMAMKE